MRTISYRAALSLVCCLFLLAAAGGAGAQSFSAVTTVSEGGKVLATVALSYSEGIHGVVAGLVPGNATPSIKHALWVQVASLARDGQWPQQVTDFGSGLSLTINVVDPKLKLYYLDPAEGWTQLYDSGVIGDLEYTREAKGGAIKIKKWPLGDPCFGF